MSVWSCVLFYLPYTTKINKHKINVYCALARSWSHSRMASVAHKAAASPTAKSYRSATASRPSSYKTRMRPVVIKVRTIPKAFPKIMHIKCFLILFLTFNSSLQVIQLPPNMTMATSPISIQSTGASALATQPQAITIPTGGLGNVIMVSFCSSSLVSTNNYNSIRRWLILSSYVNSWKYVLFWKAKFSVFVRRR